MKTRLCLLIVLCVGCATIFEDDFEADVIGNTPSASPAGLPLDDSLSFSGPAGSIAVVNSVPHGSKAVKIDRTGMLPKAVLECVTGGGPHASGAYLIGYKAYSINTSDVPQLNTAIQSSDDHNAFELTLAGGAYQLISGDGTEVLPISYSANTVHTVAIGINMDDRIFSIFIDGTTVASAKPFMEAGFNDVHKLLFEYPAPILEAFEGTYVIDDIKIVK